MAVAPEKEQRRRSAAVDGSSVDGIHAGQAALAACSELVRRRAVRQRRRHWQQRQRHNRRRLLQIRMWIRAAPATASLFARSGLSRACSKIQSSHRVLTSRSSPILLRQRERQSRHRCHSCRYRRPQRVQHHPMSCLQLVVDRRTTSPTRLVVAVSHQHQRPLPRPARRGRRFKLVRRLQGPAVHTWIATATVRLRPAQSQLKLSGSPQMLAQSRPCHSRHCRRKRQRTITSRPRPRLDLTRRRCVNDLASNLANRAAARSALNSLMDLAATLAVCPLRRRHRLSLARASWHRQDQVSPTRAARLQTLPSSALVPPPPPGSLRLEGAATRPRQARCLRPSR